MFKVPQVPRKVRKVQTNDESTSATPSNQQISNGNGNGNENGTQSNDHTYSTPSKQTEHSPEMKALFNTFVENNTTKVTDYIRTLTNGMLHDFWDAIQPMQQMQQLQNQLITMRSDYARQIDELKRENNTLKQKLSTANAKHDSQMARAREAMQQNAELQESLNETKLKMVATNMDLKKTLIR